VAIDFTIDQADLAKILTISFDYQILSSDYATGDLAVYIIQDPNGTPTVIQPAGYQIEDVAGAVPARFVATFQSNSIATTYRLCFHVASTSALQYFVAFDNISVSPQQVVYGAPVTDWQSYTPTFTSLGTVASIQMYWRRVGDTLQLRGRFTTGTGTASEARMSLPAGLVTSSTSISSIQQVGNMAFDVISANAPVVLIEPNTAYVTFGSQTGAKQGLTKELGTSYNSVTISLIATIPIAGWSSSVVISSSTDTRVVGYRGYLATNTAVTADVTKVPYTTTLDTHGAWSTANANYTIPVPGFWEIKTRALSTASSGYLRVYKNGSFLAYVQNFYSGQQLQGSYLGQFNAGDVLDIRSTGSLTLTGDADINTALSIQRLSGPSQIAASETVAASYWASANGTSSTTTPINFDSREFDTHGAVTTGASWRFTAPIAGTYQFGVYLNLTGSTATGVFVYKNGVSYKAFAYAISTTLPVGSSQLKLNAGEYIDIRTGVSWGYAGGTLTTPASNFWIERIGN